MRYKYSPDEMHAGQKPSMVLTLLFEDNVHIAKQLLLKGKILQGLTGSLSSLELFQEECRSLGITFNVTE